MAKIYARGQAQLFKNPVLEALTKTSPTLTLLTYVPILLLLVGLGLTYFALPVAKAALVYVLGVFVWTLVEYLMHRFAFHWHAEHPILKRIHYLVHGVHHEYPKDKQRLFMPPVPGIVIGFVLFGFWALLLGPWVYAFFPGFLTGYLVYVFMHFSIHSMMPKNRITKYIWNHHNVHHFKYPNKAFGVSSPVWDVIFGTMPPGKGKK